MSTPLLITVTKRLTGSIWALSPYNPEQGVQGAPVYLVPTYVLTLATADGRKVCPRDFKVIRFGLKRTAATDALPSPPELLCNVGLFSEQQHTAAWISTYRVHSGPGSIVGAWQLTGSFLLHEGSPDPSSPWGTYGCVEVVGNDEWKRLLSTIQSFSGADLATVGSRKLLTVRIQAASAPMAKLGP